MSKNYNGDNSLQQYKVSRESIDSDSITFDTENADSKGFRGFHKVPRVLLSRYDITPYLRNNRKIHGYNVQSDNLNNKHLKRISQQCSVKLVRHDLELLKQSLLTYSPRSDVSGDESMATLKCNICEKLYASAKKLLNHQENKHMIIYESKLKPQKRVSFSDHIIVHEVKEYHKCRKCPKIFEDYKSLRIHMKRKHKKRKCYICNYCNKKFVDRMFFKVHIKLHCDMCGQLLPNKTKYSEHRRYVCRTIKMHKCKTCNSSFFKFMDMKDHSYDHLSNNFICDVCKDQFVSKCAIAHHISYLHSKVRPTDLFKMLNLGTDRLYLCNFCDESSVEREIIETHVQKLPDLTNRAMTGYKDYYFCDQCFKKFNTEQDMLQHKWTHFLITSENSHLCKLLKAKRKTMKMTYKADEEIPLHMKPQILIERFDVNSKNNLKEKKKIKKTVFSEHQCRNCGKYFSSNYCLHRHLVKVHEDYENLKCNVCEEIFVYPSLLRSHKCIRLNLPEMPFDDARPEIHFDNLHEMTQNGFDDFNIVDNDDYINTVDFEIPAPIVELTEGTNPFIFDQNNVSDVNDFESVNTLALQNLGYKLVVQEVPIEF